MKQLMGLPALAGLTVLVLAVHCASRGCRRSGGAVTEYMWPISLFSSCVAAATLVCGEWRVFSSYCMLVECCTQCLVQFWLSAWLGEFQFGMNPPIADDR